ncbi:Eco57I restriction-modification methylase domain-containing protein [Caldilinea sp.]|uniref:Eco57I restriction-modification methylase domain-containing protein n=1 Tax=Caldilinea sp. TaxID=2293560 RepID=UPI00261BDE56|nr:DNA methyltransferase [uncultured Caldilinea sp.]
MNTQALNLSRSQALRIEGGLFGPDLLEALARGELPGQKPEDFRLPPRRNLTEEIASLYHDARSLWQVFQHRLERLPEGDLATSETRELWTVPLLRLLGYDLHFSPRAKEVDGLTFAISHYAGAGEHAPPVHLVGYRQELGKPAPSGRPRLSPHALVQEYLNRSEALWGLVTNGRTLRLLRDSTFVRRQAYVEFDLEDIFEEERFADFVLLYRLLHRTRLPGDGRAEECLLERYYQNSLEQGGRVRERLREGVERCIEILANGFLGHPVNESLRAGERESLRAGERESVRAGERESGRARERESGRARERESASLALSSSHALTLYQQLLRLVYRFLFLLVSEERGLMGRNPLYLESYGVTRLRRLCENRAAYTDDVDLWLGLRALWEIFRDEKLAAILGAPPLNGELFAEQALDVALIRNRDLLSAFWHLAFYEENGVPRRVNYAALDTEELGSVYESLLELHPIIEWSGSRPVFHMKADGEERRLTGSHYTPPQLVAPLIQHTLEPVLQERLAACRTNEEKQAAILNLKVLDPACGSGHFLLAAARRLGKELARLRTGEDEPAPEAIHQGVRDAITHCIYGVDKNPLAVELCRVALWLEGHERDKPLTFLEHHIRHGDSLVGLHDLTALEDGIPDEAYKPLGNADRTRLAEARKRNARERGASLFRHGFVSQPLADFAEKMRRIAEMPEATIEQVRAKRAAYQQAQSSPEFERLRLACDAYTAAFFLSSPALLTTAFVQDALSRGDLSDPQLAGQVLATRSERAFFHWALEFAEVFAERESVKAREHESGRTGEHGISPALPLSRSPALQTGFDVILGNPPFMGGLRISGHFGEAYRKWLEFAYQPFAGTADLCAAFFRRAFSLLKPGGRLGMIATNTLGQGDTRESGLAVILQQGGAIHFAQRFVKWPGQASVEVNLVALTRSPALQLSFSPALQISFSPALNLSRSRRPPHPLHLLPPGRPA